jgi:hypothetical protein
LNAVNRGNDEPAGKDRGGWDCKNEPQPECT